MDLVEGSVIGERYQLVRRIGEGGMGEVWAATHRLTHKSVALKVLKPENAARSDVVRRFFREARAASAVRHPNVVQIHDILEHEGAPVMVMDLLEGESLGERQDRQGILELSNLAAIMLPVSSAVSAAHARGIVHRDLKPENIFLARQLDGTVDPKVLDFGIAKLSMREGDSAHTAALTRTGSMMGTPFYMAPEQVFGERDTDQRADVWAFGVILYECLAGKRPFQGDNYGQVFKAITTTEMEPLASLCPELPSDVVALVTRMLAKARTDRCPDLGEATAVLSRFAAPAIPWDVVPPSLERSSPARTEVDTVAASVISSATAGTIDGATAETVMAPSMQSFVQAQATIADRTEISAVPRKARTRIWLGAAALASALAGGVVWVTSSPGVRAVSSPAPPLEGEQPTSSATPALSEPAVHPEVAPAALEEEQGRGVDAGAAELAAAPPTTGARKPAPAAKPPVSSARPPEPPREAPPSRLPGGILDQGKAPF
jgi:eukaryotic-like serine/threonine-protein kinase